MLDFIGCSFPAPGQLDEFLSFVVCEAHNIRLVPIDSSIPPHDGSWRYRHESITAKNENERVLVIDSPDFAALKDPKRHVCLAPAGTPVMPTERKAEMGGVKDFWQQVTLIAGDCANRVGWVATENLHWE